jgi:hypothetical protein
MNAPIILIMVACVAWPQNLPCQSIPASPPPHKENTLIVGCITVVIGGIIVYSLVSLCSHIPDPNIEPPPPPVTNTPITRVNWTNVFGPNWKGFYPPPGYVSPKGNYSAVQPIHSSAITQPVPFDTSQWLPSTNSGLHQPLMANGVFDSYWTVTLESSTNLMDWVAVCQSFIYECHSTNFVFGDGSVSGVAGALVNTYRGRYDSVTNNQPVFSGYRSDYQMDCAAPPDCIKIAGDKQQEFFRWVQQ